MRRGKCAIVAIGMMAILISFESGAAELLPGDAPLDDSAVTGWTGPATAPDNPAHAPAVPTAPAALATPQPAAATPPEHGAGDPVETVPLGFRDMAAELPAMDNAALAAEPAPSTLQPDLAAWFQGNVSSGVRWAAILALFAMAGTVLRRWRASTSA